MEHVLFSSLQSRSPRSSLSIRVQKHKTSLADGSISGRRKFVNTLYHINRWARGLGHHGLTFISVTAASLLTSVTRYTSVTPAACNDGHECVERHFLLVYHMWNISITDPLLQSWSSFTSCSKVTRGLFDLLFDIALFVQLQRPKPNRQLGGLGHHQRQTINLQRGMQRRPPVNSSSDEDPYSLTQVER